SPVLTGNNNLSYRLVSSSSSTYTFYQGLSSNKCVETALATSLPKGSSNSATRIFDYKIAYFGLGSPLNGLYYLSMAYGQQLYLYFVPDGSSSASLVGICEAPSGSDEYGFHSPTDGYTKGF